MQGFMMTLLICSVTMSVLGLLYMVITPFLAKRYSVMGRYYIWLIFIIGLIIPFRPQFRNAIVKIDMPVQTALPMIQGGNRTPVSLPQTPHVLSNTISNLSWWHIVTVIWLAGMIIFFVYHISKHYRFLKLTAHWNENITDEKTLTLFKNLKAQMNLSQNIDLQICDSIGSPMMIGFTNPRILLPRIDFTKEELCFILKHELVHYKRKDLWYKCLVLIATAIHWFNPIVHLMAKAINLQCELSCDAEVIHSTSADIRLYYSETIIGVVRYQSKLKTALSTNFYGGKKGMKYRIFCIMDMSKKKAGAAVLCGVLILTLGAKVAFAANVETQNPPKTDREIVVAPWFSANFSPSPEIYAPYAAFGITISEDGKVLLYQGKPVRQFVDEKADGWAFYLDESGSGNWSVVRNDAGEITGIESMTAQKAQEYYERFFAEELDPDYPTKISEEVARDIAMVQENVQVGANKYDQYQPFGITYSDEVLYFNGQRVKFFIDQPEGEIADVLWIDDAGTINLEVLRDTSGQVTGIESISDKKVQEYQSLSDKNERDILNGMEEKIEAKMKALYPES